MTSTTKESAVRYSREIWRRESAGRVVALAALAAALSLGGTCTISFPDPSNPGGSSDYVPLDQAHATIEIDALGDDAEVVADIEDRFGHNVRFHSGQALSINGRDLLLASSGEYERVISSARAYTIEVTEPTRGVAETEVDAPNGFSILEPPNGGSASLSGFVVSWSNPDPNLDVEITLTQTLFDEEESATFGPFADTGSYMLDAGDLVDFRQGASLRVTVTRTLETHDIEGLRSAIVRVSVARHVTVTPAP